jgi:penicillin amidase
MKKIKKALLALFVFLIVLILAVFLLARYMSQKPLPDYNKDIQLKGLQSEVRVIRDKYAVPHIYAENEHDLYLAVGYIMAQERLWQMDLLRRVTQGRLSEIFGRSFAETDLLLRALRYQQKSLTILEKAEPSVKQCLQAFSEGVNQFVEVNKNRLPVEFVILGYKPEPWEPYHSLNLIGYMAWDLKAGWSEIIFEEIKQHVDSTLYKELLPDLANQKSFIYPETREKKNPKLISSLLWSAEKLDKLGADIFDGSNNWAVSGNKSITGKPIFANDMHLGLNAPGIWFQMHQVIEGKLNVTGVVLPGQPLVVCGHNDSIAWGMTNVYVDNLDFYEEKVNPSDSGQYEYNGQWMQFSIVIEKIKTKEGDTIESILKYSHRGPVVTGIKDFGEKIVTMHWAGDEPSDEMLTIYLLNRAKNWVDFTSAIQTFKSVSQNIAYADVNGNIGLYCAAGVPIRKRDAVISILPGWTDEYDWKGYVPFAELPHMFNPSQEFVVSANNKTTGNNYPYHIGTWYSLPGRFERITELLAAKEKLSMADFQEIQLDQYSKMAENYMPALLKAIQNESGFNDVQKKAANELRNWDFVMKADAPAPLIFESIYLRVFYNLYADEMGEDLAAKFIGNSSVSRISTDQIWLKEASKWTDDIKTTNKTETFADILLKSFLEVTDTLSKELGSDVSLWQWGKKHQLIIAHPLSKVALLDKAFHLHRGPFAVGGSFHTVSPFSYSFSRPFVSDHGASHRHIYDLSNWDNSLTVLPTGNSGIPSSKHYCDQTNLYIQGKYHIDNFSKQAVEQNAVYRMKFVP